MRVVFVTDNGFCQKEGVYYYSGANIQHYNTIRQHFDEIIFVARNSRFDPSYNVIDEAYEVYLINGNITTRLVRLHSILNRVIKDCDVVMCFGLNGHFAQRIAMKYNKPTIVYVGGCVYDTLMNTGSRVKRLFAPVVRQMISNSIRHATFVHYVDDYLVQRYPTDGEKLICPSARISISAASLTYRERKIKNKSDTNVIGLIGYTHNKIKGIDTAIRALSLLDPRYKLQVVGRGDHGWLDKLATSLGVVDRVEFLGVLPGRDAIFEWLDTIDIYIQPSVTEGMPRATIEAMSRALPVVSSSVGGLCNVIDMAFRIEVGDHVNLANKIRILGEDKEVMLAQARRNFEIARKFDVELLDKKRNDFYADIIEKIGAG